MPFRRKDPGVTLTHKGTGKTMDGAAAAMLVNRAPGLVEEWAFYEKAADPQPRFRTRWNGYGRYGTLRLAAGRSKADKAAFFDHVAQAQTLPRGVMSSPTPVAKMPWGWRRAPHAFQNQRGGGVV